jgi:AraC family L-rhamnose operon regulatory protein RhaS
MDMFIENKKSNRKLPLFMTNDYIENQNNKTMLKILFIEAGSGILEVNEKSFSFIAPTLFCLNEKENFAVEKANSLKLRIVYFNPVIVNSAFNIENIYQTHNSFSETEQLDRFYFAPFIKRNNLNKCKIDIGPVTSKRLSNLLDSLNIQMHSYEDNFWPCRNRSFVIEILFLIHYCYSQHEKLNMIFSEPQDTIDPIILYINANYNSKITITELTKLFHTNRNSLNEKFKELTGFTIVEYIIRLRIRLACILLKDTTLPVNEIMERVGFRDASYWNRIFKRYLGCTPLKYRNQ